MINPAFTQTKSTEKKSKNKIKVLRKFIPNPEKDHSANPNQNFLNGKIIQWQYKSRLAGYVSLQNSVKLYYNNLCFHLKFYVDQIRDRFFIWSCYKDTNCNWENSNSSNSSDCFSTSSSRDTSVITNNNESLKSADLFILFNRKISRLISGHNIIEINLKPQINSIYVSIGKGFMGSYERQEIFQCPYWFEIVFK